MVDIRKMVIVGPNPYSSNLSAPSIYLRKLVSNISNILEDIDLHIVTTGIQNETIIYDDITIHSIKKSKVPLHMLTEIIKRKIVEVNPDIIHGIMQSFSTPLAHLKNRYPCLVTVLGIIAKEYKLYTNKKLSYIYRATIAKRNEYLILSKIPNIVVESTYNKRIIKQIYNVNNSKIYVIPDGVDIEYIQQIEPKNLDKDIHAFFIGNLYPIKGVDLLIRATPIITKSIPDFHLIIAGRGPQEDYLKRLVKELNLEKNIKFLGFISDEDKFKYIKSSKVVVVPSRWDFSPIVIYEAMACGKPVIASDVTNSEILIDGKTGLLFKSEDVEDLADKIITLLADPKLRKKMGKRALEKAKECDWGKIAERYIEIYKKVIADFHKQKNKNEKEGGKFYEVGK